MKLVNFLKSEGSSKALTKAMADFQGKVRGYKLAKVEAEGKLDELQELSILGESVNQGEINKFTMQVQDLEQKLKASELVLKKFEAQRAKAARLEGKDRLSKIQAELDAFQEKQRVIIPELVKTLALLASQLEEIKGLPAEKLGKKVEGHHWEEFKNILQANRELFSDELGKIERRNLAGEIKALKAEREAILAEQRAEREPEIQAVDSQVSQA
jgi:hypothetical protein